MVIRCLDRIQQHTTLALLYYISHRFPELDLVDFNATEFVFELLVELEGVCGVDFFGLGGFEQYSCLAQ